MSFHALLHLNLAVPAAQAFKWLCPETGEIFKTKKALRAAQTERAAS